jgi:hypothetical protein
MDGEGRALRRPMDAAPVPIVDAGSTWTRAALAWSAATRAAFAPGAVAPVDETPDPRDGVTSLHRVVDASTWRAWVGDTEVVAFTLLTAEGTVAPRVLRDADVLVNDAGWRISATGGLDALDELHVLGHELGHVLGLGHACEVDAPAPCEALMTPVVAPGPGVQEPGTDDLEGAEAWFPSPETRRVLPGTWRRGVGVWRCSLEGVARWRPWRAADDGGVVMDAPFVEPAPGTLSSTVVEVPDGSRFLWAEAWSLTGHGVRLLAPGVDVEDAAPPDEAGPATDAAVMASESTDAARTSARDPGPRGCGVAPASALGDAVGPSVCGLVCAALSRRRRSVLR